MYVYIFTQGIIVYTRSGDYTIFFLQNTKHQYIFVLCTLKLPANNPKDEQYT